MKTCVKYGCKQLPKGLIEFMEPEGKD